MPRWTPLRKGSNFLVLGQGAPHMGKPEICALLKNTLHPNGIGM